MRAYWAATPEAVAHIENESERKLYSISQMIHSLGGKLEFQQHDDPEVYVMTMELPNGLDHDESVSFEEYSKMIEATFTASRKL